MAQFLSSIISGLGLGVPLFLIASGLVLSYGLLKVLNFAHTGFFMIGSYIFVTIHGRFGSNTLISFALAGVVTAFAVGVLAALSEVVIFRRLFHVERSVGLLASYGLILGIQGVVALLWGTTPRSVPTPQGLGGTINAGGVVVNRYSLLEIGVGIAVVLIGAVLLKGTLFGGELRAIANDRTMARSVGVLVNRGTMTAFAVGGVLAGIAGVLQVPVVSVDPSLAVTYVLEAFAVVIVGGAWGMEGALGAAVLLGVAQSLLTSYSPQLASYGTYMIFGIMLVLLALRGRGLEGNEL